MSCGRLLSDVETKTPQFVKSLENVEVIDGQEVMLFCVITGQPMPTITWYHNNKNIAKNEEYVFTYDRQTGHIYLVILDCLADDEGEFRCVATNAAGQAVTQCNLRILPQDGSKTLSPAVQPLVINVSSVQRDSVTKTGTISPTVPKIQEPKPMSMVVTSDNAADVNGHMTSVDSLTLVPPEILVHTKKIPGQSRKVASYRTVLRRASDNDLLGYRVKSARELHRQNNSWKVSNWIPYTTDTVTSQTHAKILSASKLTPTHRSLQPTIPAAPTGFDTTGTEYYTPVVSATSKSLTFTQASKVSHVKAPAETPSTSFISSRLFEPPRFILPLTNQTVRDGEAIMLRVRFHGNPMPKLHWFFNQKAIEDEEDFVIRSDVVKGESVLWIKEIFPEDDGEFVCKVKNDYGSAVTHCRLTVQCKQI